MMYYNVKGINAAELASSDILVIAVSPDAKLPEFGDIPILHALHANGAPPMKYEEESSTLLCLCGKSLNISSLTKGLIYQALSTGDEVTNHGTYHEPYSIIPAFIEGGDGKITITPHDE